MNLKLKKWVYACLTFLSIITIKNSNAQCVELITNGDFETISGAPTGEGQIGLTNVGIIYNWGGTFSPDLFSTSASGASGMSVPCNKFGFQAAHSGNNYVGLLQGSHGPSQPYGWTEAISKNLNTIMSGGSIYEVSFWVSKADGSTKNYDNLRFSTYNSSNPISPIQTINVSASYTSDYNNWVKVTFPYCSNGTEDYISIYSAELPTSNCTPVTVSGCSFQNPEAYIYIDDVSIKEISFTVPTQTICAGSVGTFTAVPTCSTITTSALTYTWNYGDGSSTVSTNTLNITTHSYSNTGTYTAAVTVGSGSCAKTFTYNVVVPYVPITINSNINTICNGITNFTATPSPSGSYTYTWSVTDAATGTVVPTSNYTITAGTTNTPSINFGNITQNVNICVSITSTLGCQYSQCMFFPGCCPTPSNVIKYTNTTYSSATVLASATNTNAIVLSGTITVNSGGLLIIGSKEVLMDPNTKIVLNGSGKISIGSDYVHGCNYMWDGIYANGSTSGVTINNSRVEDAKRVVIDSLGGASVTMLSSYLNKNNMGVAFKATKTSASVVSIKNTLFTCSNISTAGSVPKIPTTVNLTNAPTLGAYATTFMLPPYNTQKSYCGIYFENASHTGKANSAITIGNNVNEENIFDKMQHGAFVNISKANFQNNVFQNFKSTIAPSSLNSNAGVLVWGPISGSGGPYYTQVGGASASFKNTFKDNDLGVASLFPTALLITYNRFETQNTGIYVVWNNTNQSVQTSQNKFINNQVGINYNENTLIDAAISLNWFDNTSAQGTYANNFAIRTTESVPATNHTNYAKFLVYNNYINGYYNGIYTSQTYKSEIRDNEVHMRADNTSGNFQSAIQIINTEDNQVVHNTSDYPNGSSGWWQYNIFTVGSNIPKVHCNNTNYGGVGIIANGLNNTAPGDGFYGNAMSNHAYFGFWLNNNSEIGNQFYSSGGINYSADNSWTNCPVETYVGSGGNSLGAQFFTRSSNPYKINNPANGGGFALNLSGTNSSTGFTNACYNGISTPTLNLKVAGASAQKLVMQKADEIANGTIHFTENDASLKQIARSQLLRCLKLNQIDPSFSNDVVNFVNNAKQSSLGTFFLVDSLINTGDTANLTLANSINNGIATSNDVDVTQQQFNAEYITYLKNKRKAKSSNIIAFENIAYQCPVIYGHAVYQARSVLFNLTKKQYVNACEKDNGSSKRFASSVINQSAVNVKLFPNPSNGNMTLQTADDLSYTIVVYNLLGEKVFESSASNNQSLNLAHLSSATYIVHIQHNGNLIKTERISIVH